MEKILVVEDNDIYFEMISSVLSGKVEIERATDLQEAETIFFGNNNFNLVVITACLKSDIPNTMQFVRKIAKKNNKNILGTSFSLKYRGELKKAGATNTATKTGAAYKIKELLGLD